MKSAVITGITGQDAAYLARLLIDKGYMVYGTHRRDSHTSLWRLHELGIASSDKLHILLFEAKSLADCTKLVDQTQPVEIYNLAGQTSAVDALKDPLGTAEANGMAVVFLLEAIRLSGRHVRFFQAGSSELFGQAQEIPQTEETLMAPTNPYGVAKLFAHWAVINYRQAYGVFAASGILFNHESPLRGTEFVTRKITQTFARLRRGENCVLELGNLESKRDWAYAADFVHGMWLTLQAAEPDTYVFGTNQMHTVREFVTLVAEAAGFELSWRGSGAQQVAYDRNTGAILVKVNPAFYRSLEIEHRVGNPEKAIRVLGWQPTTSLRELCKIMVDADITRLSHLPSD